MIEITVQGYKVTVEQRDGAYTVSVPELPGCTTQVAKKEDIPHQIEGVIGNYLKELVRKKPANQPATGQTGRKGRDEQTVKLRR